MNCSHLIQKWGTPLFQSIQSSFLQVVSSAAFAPSQLGASTGVRVRSVTCSLRMQTDSIAESSADEGEGDGPKLSRAQRRLQEKYTKKNTDGSAKTTSQVRKATFVYC